MVAAKKPRPCRVCGKEPTVTYDDNCGIGLWVIGCGGEGQDHHLWLAKAGARGREQAVAEWNRRAGRHADG